MSDSPDYRIKQIDKDTFHVKVKWVDNSYKHNMDRIKPLRSIPSAYYNNDTTNWELDRENFEELMVMLNTMGANYKFKSKVEPNFDPHEITQSSIASQKEPSDPDVIAVYGHCSQCGRYASIAVGQSECLPCRLSDS